MEPTRSSSESAAAALPCPAAVDRASAAGDAAGPLPGHVPQALAPEALKAYLFDHVLPRVQTPAQYIGGEWNAVRKPPESVRGRVCLAFPDLYTIGMSHHGLQVLYDTLNRRADWACERAFAPMTDMEAQLRTHRLPLFALESHTPLAAFDVLGFTLQYDLCYTSVLTMLDLAGIPIVAEERGPDVPLVLAGGPCTVNPEPMARFIDAFAIGDGEILLPAVCEAWREVRAQHVTRAEQLAALARRVPGVYVPQCYAPRHAADGRHLGLRPLVEGVPTLVQPAVLDDLDAEPLPTRPVVPWVECVQDRITFEIMRGCPGKCRFCQSTTLKRPLRFRRVETLLAAAEAAYAATGFNEISLLSLSTSDYPHFAELVGQLQARFRPRGVAISVPSLRVNEQLQAVSELLNTDRHSGLTLAPEAARDALRRRIGKPISNADLLAGCRRAFENGFQRVKLYFMCGLPGETDDDLRGIVELAEEIARLGRAVSGRFPAVVANVSNLVPKPQTPFQWDAMQRAEYFHRARQLLRDCRRIRAVDIKCHDVETSLLEGVLSRGGRQVGHAVERAWRPGARLDAWSEHHRKDLWRQALAEAGVDVEAILHTPLPRAAVLPWDHIAIRQGREYLEKEHAAAEACV